MKWYFASRTKHLDKIQELSDFLKSQGHEISYEWSKLGSLEPYHENSEKCSIISDEIALALKETDVFVLFSDKGGTDMYIESGIALGCNLFNNYPKIYVVGEFNNRSMMHYLSKINRVDSLEDVFNQECPELVDKIGITLLEYFKKLE